MSMRVILVSTCISLSSSECLASSFIMATLMPIDVDVSCSDIPYSIYSLDL